MKKIKQVFVFFSGSASGARYMMENDPEYGKTYIFVGAFTNNHNASGVKYFNDKDMDVFYVDSKEFLKKHSVNKFDDELREEYFKEVIYLMEMTDDPDLILFSGFMLIVSKVLLEQYKILNVHPANLSIGDSVTGKRKYVGAKAVKLAYADGVETMNSTAHYLHPDPNQIDAGEIVAISSPHEVNYQITWQENQEIMKTTCDGPVLIRAMEIVCSDE